MFAKFSPFLVEVATVEEVFQPQHRSFVPIPLDLDDHTEQLLEHVLDSIHDGLVLEPVDHLFMGQAFTG